MQNVMNILLDFPNTCYNACRLIITHGKPHHYASCDMLSRCVTEELQLTGIDVNVFNTHSCRAASVGKARQKRISLNDIFKTGCWSKEHMPKRFYSKGIINIDNREMD